MDGLNGARALLEVLAASGAKYLFGNPGSTELPLMDALAADPKIEYILALQEIPAVAMADGHAQATRTPAVVNLHVACGVGNAMGMLYNAWCAGTPLIVTAGQQDRRLLAEEPVLAGDLLGVARPWTKWAAEPHRVEDIAPAARRAIREALTPPTGPVLLSLPVDVQCELATAADLSGAPVPRGPLADEDSLHRAVQVLLGATRPVILAGSRVTESGASEVLAELAERLGAPVYADTQASNGRLPVASDHPLFAGSLPLWSSDIHAVLSGYDVALVAGMSVFRQYVYHEPACPIPDGMRLVQVDCNTREIGKNYPPEAGVAGDIRAALAELRRLLSTESNWGQSRAALERKDRIASAREKEIAGLRSEMEKAREQQPMTATALVGALASVFPANGVLVDEAPTTGASLLARAGAIKTPTGYFGHRGWELGWGLGCALGVKLAWPDRPTLALLGDGAALYGIQGLWTAARYSIPVVFVIANNRQYKILKNVGRVMGLPEALKGNHLAQDLTDPEVDYISLSRSFGVDAHRVATADELTERVAAGLAGEQPVLLDVALEV